MMDSLDLGALGHVSRLLAGKKEEAVAMIVGAGKRGYVIYLAKNLKRSPVEFEADPWNVVQAHVMAEKYGAEVIGILHTHPSCPPVPSEMDRRGMREWPIFWVIACPGEARAWRLRGEELEEVPLT